MITQEFADWLTKEDKRVDHEWSKWDGTQADGIRINDAQVARIWAARTQMQNTGIAEKRPDTWPD